MADLRAAVPPPATTVWFDLESRVERPLAPGEPLPDRGAEGFLWVDAELSASESVAALVGAGAVPVEILEDDPSAGEVDWSHSRDHVHLRLAGARLHDISLMLDRRHVVIAEGAVITLHRGVPDHHERLRARYAEDFARFARSHGFLIFEVCGQLVDDLQGTVRALGDRIDGLRVAVARGSDAARDDPGPELLSSLLLMRRVLVRTRDVLVEVSSRRTAFVPESTQPYLRDMAERLDGLVADLAFSRDVLSQALDARDEERPGAPAPPEPQAAARRAAFGPRRAPLRVLSLGGFDVIRGGEAVPWSDFGRERARELFAALLCARRAVHREEVVDWLWPDLPGERGLRALQVSVADVARALEPERPADAPPSVILTDGDVLQVALGDEDFWDAQELIVRSRRAGDVVEPGRRVEELEDALRLYRGPLYPEWRYSRWSQALRAECEQAQLMVRAALALALLQVGRAREAIPHFEALLEAEPEGESWHRGLMRAYSQTGERARALRQFHACRSVLRQAQGLEPSPETNALYLELLRGG